MEILMLLIAIVPLVAVVAVFIWLWELDT